MKLSEVNKRRVHIPASPLPKRAEPRQVRREASCVENISEYDESLFDDFDDFDKELRDVESARQQFERLEMERIQYENRMKELGIEEKKDPENYFVFEEIEEEEEIPAPSLIEQFFEIREEEDELEEIETKFDLENHTASNGKKLCAFVRESGELCRKVAPRNNPYCRTHRYIKKI